MKNFVQPGESVEYAAPRTLVSGEPVQIGQIVAVATVDVANTVRASFLLCGVISFTKLGSQAWAEGAIVYWDDGAKKFTTVASGNIQAGTAVVAVGGGAEETTGVVRLDGVGHVEEDT